MATSFSKQVETQCLERSAADASSKEEGLKADEAQSAQPYEAISVNPTLLPSAEPKEAGAGTSGAGLPDLQLSALANPASLLSPPVREGQQEWGEAELQFDLSFRSSELVSSWSSFQSSLQSGVQAFGEKLQVCGVFSSCSVSAFDEFSHFLFLSVVFSRPVCLLWLW